MSERITSDIFILHFQLQMLYIETVEYLHYF